ncbi:hypothetical protein RF11_10449 [Thelohanellus kitauei]|uniref:Uncharacterized protein n=1 Tax=Thelohanellus kitauei TaxID=669202 RepID=A0A0C2NFN5_THEKT|nr:hypothetical protein RF11_10449 [Thelohanellus kitauei]
MLWVRHIEHPNLTTPIDVEVKIFFTLTPTGHPLDEQTILFPYFEGNSVSLYLKNENTIILDVKYMRLYKFVQTVLIFADNKIEHSEPIDFEAFDCHSVLNINGPHLSVRGASCNRQVPKEICPSNSHATDECQLGFSIQPDVSNNNMYRNQFFESLYSLKTNLAFLSKNSYRKS